MWNKADSQKPGTHPVASVLVAFARKARFLSGPAFTVPAALFIILLFSACQKPAVERKISGLRVLHDLPLSWEVLEDGLWFSRLEFEREENGGRISLAALRVSSLRFRFKVLSAPELMGEPSGWVHEMRDKSGALAAVNGSFYLPDSFQPIGLLVSEGEVKNPWKKGAGSGGRWLSSRTAGPGFTRTPRNTAPARLRALTRRVCWFS